MHFGQEGMEVTPNSTLLPSHCPNSLRREQMSPQEGTLQISLHTDKGAENKLRLELLLWHGKLSCCLEHRNPHWALGESWSLHFRSSSLLTL